MDVFLCSFCFHIEVQENIDFHASFTPPGAVEVRRSRNSHGGHLTHSPTLEGDDVTIVGPSSEILGGDFQEREKSIM